MRLLLLALLLGGCATAGYGGDKHVCRTFADAGSPFYWVVEGPRRVIMWDGGTAGEPCDVP